MGGAESERTRPDQRLPKRSGAPEGSATAEDGEAGDERVAGEQTVVDEPAPRVPADGWTAELPAPARPAEEPVPDDETAPGPPDDDETAPDPPDDAEATRPAPLPSAPGPDDADTTRPAPLPAPAEPEPPVPAPRPEPASASASAPAPAPASPVQGGAGEPGKTGPGESLTWHRMHYAVGVFLIAYGVTGLISGTLLWGDRREEVEDYFVSGPAGGILVLAKVVQVALVLVAAAAMARRRDTWFVPPLAGWMAGFALFAVLDVYTAQWTGLLEHLLYLAGFVMLLFLSYGLSAKVQTGGAARTESGPEPEGLSRTQELALAAINRLPRR